MDYETMINTGIEMTRQNKPIRAASLFFKQCPKGYTKAYKDIGHYLINMGCFLKYGIDDYRNIANNILKALPQYAIERMFDFDMFKITE